MFGLFKKKEKAKTYTYEEKRKESRLAYEKWRESEDNILKSYWNDKSNRKSRSEKVQELSQKLERGRGAIRSSLEKFSEKMEIVPL